MEKQYEDPTLATLQVKDPHPKVLAAWAALAEAVRKYQPGAEAAEISMEAWSGMLLWRPQTEEELEKSAEQKEASARWSREYKEKQDRQEAITAEALGVSVEDYRAAQAQAAK